MVPSQSWVVEARRVGIVAVLALVAGLVSGYPLICLLLAGWGLLFFHLIQLRQLERWLQGGSREPIDDLSGPMAALHDRVYRLQRRSKKRKKRLRRAADEVRDAARAAPDATVLIGPSDEILWCNKSAADWLGLREQLDRGQPIANLIRGPDFVEYLEAREFAEPLEMAAPVDEDIRLLVRIVPYGKNRHLLSARNVTRLHRLEEVRKDFVANVSHELRSPLTVVVGYLETLADDPQAPERWMKPIEQMNQQAKRMCSLVEDLLRLSRLERDPNSAPHTPIDVKDMLESIAREAKALGHTQHDISVEAQSHDALRGDYNELYSAFSNIVFNAVQYTPPGGSIVLAWTQHGLDNRAVTVRDTGIGVDEVNLPRLTERFYRVDKARSRELGGTGLGLAIVKHILVRHGAHLTIESEIGEGSTFSCVFPPERILSARQDEADETGDTSKADAPAADSLRDERTDDDKDAEGPAAAAGGP